AALLVIDDGSRDETAREARAAGAAVVVHPFNLGYGAALLTGYRYARAHGYARVIQMDADGQHDPGSILALCAALDGGADLVLGSRFLDRGSYRPPWSRRLGMRLFGWLASLLLRRRITDPTTGYQALSARLVAFHAGSRDFPHDFPDANVIVRCGRAGFRVVEVPVRMRDNPEGGSLHVGWKPVAYVFKMLVALALEASRRRSSREE
ncbi:MAG: glycosyltransferase family 2 protein, partial [Candidatus Eisenbacteria bacterium]